MQNNVLYITQEGLEALKLEMHNLKEVKRIEVAQRIKLAREFGNLDESMEFEAALDEQAIVEARIQEIIEVLQRAQIPELTITGEIVVGSRVTLELAGETELFHIVGATEADPLNNKISNESPLGAALVGKTKGTVVEVAAPIGLTSYKVVHVE